MPLKNSLETVLIVQDNRVVLDVLRSILEHAGFCVLTAQNSTQAIQVEDGFYQRIDLLLCDVMMPDMSGPVISRILKKHRPEMRVMLMSGYPDGHMLFLNHGWHFIEKQHLAAKLVQRVKDALYAPVVGEGEDRFAHIAEKVSTSAA